jgi:hypothetical protein
MQYGSVGPFEFDASEIRVGETFSACVQVIATGEINSKWQEFTSKKT